VEQACKRREKSSLPGFWREKRSKTFESRGSVSRNRRADVIWTEAKCGARIAAHIKAAGKAAASVHTQQARCDAARGQSANLDLLVPSL